MSEDNADFEKDVSSLIDVSTFSAARHNKTNHSDYRKFQERMERLQGYRVEKELDQARRENLRKWVKSLPSRWKKATLNSIDRNPKEAEDVKNRISKGVYNFYVTGNSSSGKTYFCYAIIRRLISEGIVNPSEVKIISESEILSYANNGYMGQNEFSKLLGGRYKLIFIDHMGSKDFYDERRELPMMSALIDYIYSNSCYLIATSNVSYKKFSKSFGLSTFSRFEDLVEPGAVTLPGGKNRIDTEETEDSSRSDDLESFEKWPY